MKTVKVIGGGLAGTEAALYLAKKGIKVILYDIKHPLLLHILRIILKILKQEIEILMTAENCLVNI